MSHVAAFDESSPPIAAPQERAIQAGVEFLQPAKMKTATKKAETDLDKVFLNAAEDT